MDLPVRRRGHVRRRASPRSRRSTCTGSAAARPTTSARARSCGPPWTCCALPACASSRSGPAEPCCGEPAKRLGEEGRFQMLAMTAIEMIKETGAQKDRHALPARPQHVPVRVPCAGLHDPGDAPRGAARRSAGCRTPRGGSGRPAPIAYHEPCNLARAGRPAAAALGLLGGAGRLPERSGVRTFCCGGGGGNSFYQVEQEERRISAIRYEELVATGAEQGRGQLPVLPDHAPGRRRRARRRRPAGLRRGRGPGFPSGPRGRGNARPPVFGEVIRLFAGRLRTNAW